MKKSNKYNAIYTHFAGMLVCITVFSFHLRLRRLFLNLSAQLYEINIYLPILFMILGLSILLYLILYKFFLKRFKFRLRALMITIFLLLPIWYIFYFYNVHYYLVMSPTGSKFIAVCEEVESEVVPPAILDSKLKTWQDKNGYNYFQYTFNDIFYSYDCELDKNKNGKYIGYIEQFLVED